MALPTSLLAGSTSVLLALVLSAPAVASAAPRDPSNNDRGQQQAEEQAEQHAVAQSERQAEQVAAAQAREESSEQREEEHTEAAEAREETKELRESAAPPRNANVNTNANANANAKGNGNGNGKATATKVTSKVGAASSAAAEKGPKTDPPGNNGTIKVDYVPADDARANRPHPGCAVSLTFFNFDASQHADITFTSIPPSGGGEVVRTYSNRLISTSPADGSMEAEHTIVVTAADLGLTGTAPTKQGWHVKVAVDSVEAPGGAKQKVFWLNCPAEQASASLAPTFGSGTATVTPPIRAAAPNRISVLRPAAPAALTFGSAALTVAPVTVRPVRAQAARGAAVPAQLPRTGASGFAGALTGAVGAILIGALMLLLGRRQTA
ncbi:MAG TPA: hypothetical protein VNA30_05030 [Mycobacteriales bacterium]|nr:hypothetical protein [Mycobacteriales bacterium]